MPAEPGRAGRWRVTDDESFGDILASFPFTTDDLRLLQHRARNLLKKTEDGWRYADGTLDARSRRQLLALSQAVGSLIIAAADIEADRDPATATTRCGAGASLPTLGANLPRLGTPGRGHR